jgi:hypothetical protein
MSVIPRYWEAEIRNIRVPGQSRQKKLARCHLNGKKLSMVECASRPSRGTKSKTGGSQSRLAQKAKPYLQTIRAKRARSMAPTIQHLSTKRDALNSNPSAAKINKVIIYSMVILGLTKENYGDKAGKFEDKKTCQIWEETLDTKLLRAKEK